MEDNDIIDLFWVRSENAISAVAEKYGAYCHKIAHNILGNQQDAEECVNDTYLQVWKNIPPERPVRLVAYLGRITRNLSLSRVRYYKAQKRGCDQLSIVLSELGDCIPAANDLEKEMEDRLLVEAIQRFLRILPAERRTIFVRRYWYMESIKVIAKHYGMSQSKATSLLFHIRKDLKEFLEKEGLCL